MFPAILINHPAVQNLGMLACLPAAAGTPYELRHWLDQDEPALRDFGCHRVVLTEEVARFLAGRDLRTEVIEIDQALGRCQIRSGVGPGADTAAAPLLGS